MGGKRAKSLNYVMTDKKNVFVFYSLLLKDILDFKKNKTNPAARQCGAK